MYRRHIAIVALLASALLLAVSCTPPPEDAAAREEIRIHIPRGPVSLSLIGGKGDRYSTLVGRLVSDGLIGFDAGLSIQPRVAESWELSEDHRTLTFRLREGVRWHDGTPVTSADVAYTVEMAQDPATESFAWADGFEDVEAIETPDERTVVVRYREAFADMMNAWWIPLIPKHLASLDEDFLTGTFAQSPVGCGPYRFVEAVSGERVVLERNEDYWDGPAKNAGLLLRVHPDERTAYESFLRGEIDMMASAPAIWSEAADAERAQPLRRDSYRRMSGWFIAWNQQESLPYFQDAGVRRAMMHALDRVGFGEKVLNGVATPAITSWHPDGPWAHPKLEALAYDPDLARKLLDEAGWVDTDGDGVRERNGRDFRFELLTLSSTQEIVDRMTAWVQQSLREVGVAMTVRKTERAGFLESRNSGGFDAVMTGLSFDLSADQTPIYRSHDASYNWVAYGNDEVDRLLEQGKRTFDQEERQAIYRRIQEILLEEQPIGWMFHFGSPFMYDARLRGLEPSPLGIYRIEPGVKAWHWESAPAGK